MVKFIGHQMHLKPPCSQRFDHYSLEIDWWGFYFIFLLNFHISILCQFNMGIALWIKPNCLRLWSILVKISILSWRRLCFLHTWLFSPLSCPLSFVTYASQILYLLKVCILSLGIWYQFWYICRSEFYIFLYIFLSVTYSHWTVCSTQ